MDKKIAKHVASVSFEASKNLGSLISFLKRHCSQEDYEKFRDPIATISASIGLDILNVVFSDFPDLEKEFDDDIKKYGKIL